MRLLLAIGAGALIGLALGALGGGGSILAVPVLVYLLDQDAGQATTGSLVVVGVTSLIAAVSAYRAGNVRLGSGITFGVLAIGGAAVGAMASTHVPDSILLASFAALMLIVGGLMTLRQLRRARGAGRNQAAESERDGGSRAAGREGRIISFRGGFACDCRRAATLLGSATVVGLLTGFLGVGGGFLIVPALAIVLGLPMNHAVGTSLVVISLTSAAALAVRAGQGGPEPDWGLVAALTLAAAFGGLVGAWVAGRADATILSAGFTILVMSVAIYTSIQAVSALV